MGPEHVAEELVKPLLEHVNSCERYKSSPGEQIEVGIDTRGGTMLEGDIGEDIVIALVGP